MINNEKTGEDNQWRSQRGSKRKPQAVLEKNDSVQHTSNTVNNIQYDQNNLLHQPQREHVTQGNNAYPD